MRLTFLLLLSASVVLSMIYYVPTDVTLPDELYLSSGSKSVNFQYLVFSNEPDIVILLKGWIFSPTNWIEERSFNVVATGEDFKHEFTVKGVRKGIYFYMPQHLFVLPANTKSITVNGVPIELPRKLSFSTKRINVGAPETGLAILNEFMKETQDFKAGEKIFLRIDAGRKNTGGYDVRIEDLKLVGSTIIVKAYVVSPAPGAMVTQVITYPSILVEITDTLPPGYYTVKCTLIDTSEKLFQTRFEVR